MKTAPERIGVTSFSGTALSPEMDKRNMGHLELARLGQAAGVRNLVMEIPVGAPAPAKLE